MVAVNNNDKIFCKLVDVGNEHGKFLRDGSHSAITSLCSVALNCRAIASSISSCDCVA